MSEYLSAKQIVSFIRELYGEKEKFIPLHSPVFIGNEKEYLNECIDSTFVSSVGEFVNAFENKVADYTGSPFAIACANGTSALHIALLMAGVKPDTEVITQSLTFVATINAIRYCQAQPVFLDIDDKTLGLSVSALQTWLSKFALKKSDGIYNKRSGKKISACLPMHTFGLPLQIDALTETCENFGIPLVEDAAEAIGSFYKNQHCGTFGQIGIISFNGNKLITTGGGGIILTANAQLASQIRHLTTQAKIPHPWHFEHDQIGYNYRMPNINAAIGLAQLETIQPLLQSKRKIAKAYSDFFSGKETRFIEEPELSHSNYWLNAVLFKNQTERDKFLEYANDMQVQARPPWRPVHGLPMFKNFQKDELKVTQAMADRIANLPSSPIIKAKHV
jgi:perosamine synthetase